MASNETTAKRAALDNAKIETLAEAIENLALCLATKVNADKSSAMMEKYMADSREELRGALRVFMAPNLCLVEPRQPYQNDVPKSNQIKCSSCKNNIACKADCFFWHKALLDSIEPAPPPEPPRPRAA